MPIEDYKIRIIPSTPSREGNDIPSQIGDENDPNSALLCANFNSLIDELNSLSFTNDQSSSVVNLFVDSLLGSDTNDGLTSTTAFQTINRLQQALDFRICNFGQIQLNFKGNFTNFKLDFSTLILKNNSNFTGITITSTDTANKAEIQIIDKNPFNFSALKVDYLNINSLNFDLRDSVIEFNNLICETNLNDIEFDVTGNTTFNPPVSFNHCNYLLLENIRIPNKDTNNSFTGMNLYGCNFVELDTISINIAYAQKIYCDGCRIRDLNGHNLGVGAWFELYACVYHNDSINQSDLANLNFFGDSIVITWLGLFAPSDQISSKSDMVFNANDSSGKFLFNGTELEIINGAFKSNQYQNSSGNKIIGSRLSGIPNANPGTEITTINAILTAMRTHGLIAP